MKADDGGPDDPDFFAGLPEFTRTRSRNPWWVTGRNLPLALTSAVVWLGLFVLRIFQVAGHRTPSGLSVGLLVITGLLGLAYVPSVVYFARHPPHDRTDQNRTLE